MNAMTIQGDRWCILRTTGPRTLPLARSLAESGIEVWTPVQTMSRRRPRSKMKVEREVPIAPTFVFAHARHIAELAAIRMMPANPHPGFSIFHHAGRVPLVNESEITGMRAAEDGFRVAAKKSKAKRNAFTTGQEVRVPSGPFAGMTGVVEDGDGKLTLVCFGAAFKVRIGSWLLEGDSVGSALALTGIAA
jgi:transcription antitermination factor NusG